MLLQLCDSRPESQLLSWHGLGVVGEFTSETMTAS